MTSKPAARLFSGIAVAILLTISLAMTGCGKNGAPKVASDTKAFESASPEIKAAWEKALSAASSNDCATAILTCRRLQTQGSLTPQQVSAVSETLTAVNNQMLNAVEKGDKNAIRDLEKVRKGWRMR